MDLLVRQEAQDLRVARGGASAGFLWTSLLGNGQSSFMNVAERVRCSAWLRLVNGDMGVYSFRGRPTVPCRSEGRRGARPRARP
jgi:hypothetical protein